MDQPDGIDQPSSIHHQSNTIDCNIWNLEDMN
jgi:hypothetical protein